MNVALVCHVYPPEHAPAGVMMAELAADLAKGGHEVTVVTGWPAHPTGVLAPGWRMRWRAVEQDPLGFRVVRCAHSLHRPGSRVRRALYYLTFAASTLSSGVRCGRFDVVFSLSTPIFGGWAAWLLARLKRARFVYGVFDLHPEAAANAGMMPRRLTYRVLRRADTSLCRRSDAVLTPSAGLRDEILARGVGGGKVAVVPVWLDGGKVRPGPRDNAWRRAQGVAPGAFVALYAGTIGYVSGAEVLVEVARRLESRRDILVLCVGEGPVKERLMEAAAGLGLTNIRFLPFQPAPALSEMQAAADVGLVTLLPAAGRTSFPSKVLGYLAAARPVVASVATDSDTARVIGDGACGRVTACLDPSALAEAVRDLADHPEQAREMGRRGRAYFERRFDRGPCVAAVERLLCRPAESTGGGWG